MASHLHSRAAVAFALMLGVAAGAYLAPRVDLERVAAVAFAHVAQVWALLG